jgi:hypothetical protein
VIETEGHVPGLAGEDQQDAGQFQADIGMGKARDQGQHDRRKERENRNALQNIQDGHHHGFRPAIRRGDMPIDQREDEGEQVRQEHAQQRIPCIDRQHARDQLNMHRRSQWSRPARGRQHQQRHGGEHHQGKNRVNKAKASWWTHFRAWSQRHIRSADTALQLFALTWMFRKINLRHLLPPCTPIVGGTEAQTATLHARCDVRHPGRTMRVQ